MSFRVRQRFVTEQVAGVAYPIASGLNITNSGAGIRRDDNADFVGNRTIANPLTIEHTSLWRWSISGVCQPWWNTDKFVTSLLPVGHNTMPGGSPSDNAALAMGLARTNPNRPEVDLPVFLFELADIPNMLRRWGQEIMRTPFRIGGAKDLRFLPRQSARRYIEYQFGILPFLRDLAKILDFQGTVDKKVAALKKLGNPLATSSSATVWSAFAQSGPWNDYATTLYQEHRQVTSMYRTDWKAWVSTKWKSQIPLPAPGSYDERQLARRLAFGEDISFSTLWEAMPWSWLIDWFSNIGDIAMAHRNTIPVTHGGSCVMRMATSKSVITGYILPVSGDTISVNMPPFLYQTKSRGVMGDAAPLPEFNLPFLSGEQLSILSALAVLKRSN